MTDDFIRDALGRFADHIHTHDEVTLPAPGTAVEGALRDALTRFEADPNEAATADVVKFATARFIELSSKVFGRATSITYWFSDGKPRPEWLRTRGFGEYSFDPNQGDYPHAHSATMTELEALATAINRGGQERIELRIPDGVTIIDKMDGSWPREVGQEHLDADYDHDPVAPNDDEECRVCGLAVTSDLRRHGFDAS